MIVMLQDDPIFDQANETYYSVARLKSLLPLYPILGYSRPPKDPDVRIKVHKATGNATWSEASAKAADLERAIRWLNERDWRAAFVIRATLIVGLSERDARDYLSREHGQLVTQTTINRWKHDGLSLMSAYLCGRLPVCGGHNVSDDVF